MTNLQEEQEEGEEEKDKCPVSSKVRFSSCKRAKRSHLMLPREVWQWQIHTMTPN
jgi:hypothetical protein